MFDLFRGSRRFWMGTLLLLFAACIETRGGAGHQDAIAPAVRAAVGEFEVVFVNVGQGDCTLVKCPNGKRILIDCGSTSKEEIVAALKVREAVRAHLDPGTPTVDILIVTHPDADHYNLLSAVLGNDVAIRRVLLPGSAEDTEGREDLLRQYRSGGFGAWIDQHKEVIRWVDQENEVRPNRAPSGYFQGCGEVKGYILAANVGGDDANKNDRSIVLRLSYKEFDMVLTGDATKATENYILSKYRDSDDDGSDWLDIDFLKVGHHGSRATSSQGTWLARLRPEYAMASAGVDNKYGHPARDVVNRVAPYLKDVPEHRVMQSAGQDQPVDEVVGFKKALWVTCANGTLRVRSAGADRSADVDPERN